MVNVLGYGAHVFPAVAPNLQLCRHFLAGLCVYTFEQSKPSKV